MTTFKQKNEELIYARCASDLLEESWEIGPAPDEMNWPDLVCSMNGKKFGLEVTEIFLDEGNNGSKKREVERYNSRTVAQLANLYYTRSTVPIVVDILGDITQSEKLLGTILSNLSNCSEAKKRRLDPYQGCRLYVRLLPSKFANYKRWTYVSDNVGWVANIGIDFLESKIIDKAKKLEKYSINMADIRLLLVSNRVANSGKADLTDQACCETHGFREVYYLSYPEAVLNLGS